MPLGFHLGDDLLNEPFFIDDKGGPHESHVLLPKCLFQTPNAICLDCFSVFIDQKRERQIVFFDEILVFLVLMAIATYLDTKKTGPKFKVIGMTRSL